MLFQIFQGWRITALYGVTLGNASLQGCLQTFLLFA